MAQALKLCSPSHAVVSKVEGIQDAIEGQVAGGSMTIVDMDMKENIDKVAKRVREVQ